MLVKVRSVFDCDSEELFREIKRTKSLIYIAKPIVRFVQLPDHSLPEIWEEGKYVVKMYILSFIPFGK